MFHYDGAESFTNQECHIWSCGPCFSTENVLEAKWLICCIQNRCIAHPALFDAALDEICRFIGFTE